VGPFGFGQLDFFCSKSATFRRNSWISRCMWEVAAPTKKKHIGRKQRNIIFQPPASEIICIKTAIDDKNPQNAAGIQ
jgi:hypothetical protein